MKTIYPLQTQQVRDLAWACFGEPLMLMEQVTGKSTGITDCTLALTPARQQWLEQLDRDATTLLEHLALHSSHRLGVYFEQLWHFFLREDPQVTLVAHNLPVHHQGRTLGEFDCIYFCHQRRRHVHLELAVKFFLGTRSDNSHQATSKTSDWLGPDTRDRLDLKLDHLVLRQIQLGRQHVAQQQLAALGIGDRDSGELAREIAFKGYLFSHPEHSRALPTGCNRRLRLNAWLTRTELPRYLQAAAHDAYRVLPKMQWLCAAQCADAENTLAPTELESRITQHFTGNSYPLLVAALDGRGVEAQRFFVTPAHWPAIETVATLS